MQIIRRPFHYTMLALLIVLAIPIFILNLWIIQKGVLAKVFRPTNLWWIGIQAIWVLATLRALLKAKWLGFWSFQGLSAALLLANVLLLVSMKNYALAFYALFLLILAGMYSLHLYRNLNEPYYDSGQQWYEGLPPFIPHVEASLRVGEKSVPVRLSRLGVEGCFVFTEVPVKIKRGGSITLKLGDRQLESAVESISRSNEGRGWGLRFAATCPDDHKDVRDFIDRVRSMGYVS